MVRIIADSSTMYSSADARDAGFCVAPLAVSIGGETYRELDEIDSKTFTQLIRLGQMPTSSQPSPADVLSLYDQWPADEIINVSMADGLSGTYSTAVVAAQMAQNSDRISVINTRTLCGPHRYLTETAVKLAQAGFSRPEILARLEEMTKHVKSFLMPADFDYLRRGGRLSPLVSFVGKTIRLVPVLTQSEDGRQLVMSGIKRSFRQGVEHICSAFEQLHVGDKWRIYITHADAPTLAQQAYALLQARFPAVGLHIFPLTPVFITQGGPGCVAIQAIREAEY